MISETTAMFMMMYALIIGVTLGVILAFVIDLCAGWITFHRVFRLIQRCQYAWAIRHHKIRYPEHNYNRPFVGGDLEFQDEEL